MEGLAGRKVDKKAPQTRGGRVPVRDIVTFVNMQSFNRYTGYGNIYQHLNDAVAVSDDKMSDEYLLKKSNIKCF